MRQPGNGKANTKEVCNRSLQPSQQGRKGNWIEIELEITRLLLEIMIITMNDDY